jgi:sRNA-binding carbon storage regulator CsrA
MLVLSRLVGPLGRLYVGNSVLEIVKIAGKVVTVAYITPSEDVNWCPLEVEEGATFAVGNAAVCLIKVLSGKVRIGIDAPQHIPVQRRNLVHDQLRDTIRWEAALMQTLREGPGFRSRECEALACQDVSTLQRALLILEDPYATPLELNAVLQDPTFIELRYGREIVEASAAA